MGMTVRVGQRASSSSSVNGYLTLVESSKAMLVSIGQNVLRHVRVGQPAEIATKAMPGEILDARVPAIAAMNQLAKLVSAAIYTDELKATHAIRRIMIRLETW